MEERTKVDKDYKEAFNQGYQLSKELNLKPDILKGLSSGNNRIKAMQEGMEQHQRDVEMEKCKLQDKDIIPPLEMDDMDNPYIDLNIDDKDIDKDQSMDMDY